MPLVDGEPAAFCPACGLPQLRVSESVLDAAAARAQSGSAEPVEGTTAVPDGGLHWPLMLRILLVATAVGLLPCLVLRDVLFSGAAGFAVLLLLPILGLGSGVAYTRWRPQARLSAGAGARMGLALGTMLAFAESTVTAIASFALRYGRHDGSLERNFNLVMQQAEAQARVTQPEAPEHLLLAMRSAEWHAGWFLVMEGALMVLLLLGGAVAGLVAGALLGARQRALRPEV